MTIEAPTQPIRLEPVSGPTVVPMDLAPDQATVIGRSLQCTCTFADESVSRRHATISCRAGRWLISDLGSRHGTFLNSCRLDANDSAVLAHNDLITIGPYSFVVCMQRSGSVTMHTTTTEDDRWTKPQIEHVGVDELERLAQHRMNLLVECAASIHGTHDENELADVVLQSALDGTGYQHAALLRPSGADEMEILGYRDTRGSAAASMRFSRSLISEASGGVMVRLNEPAQLPTSMSIAELGITSALCAPIMLGQAINAFLYLDARSQNRPVESDAAGFCQVIARMCGLAMSNMKRIDLEQRQRLLDADIAAAREAQRMITPANEGVAGPVRYALQVRPGRFVAGDLFEVIQLSEQRTAVVIGDVVGEGVGAAVIMAAAQSHLHCMLRRTSNPAEAVGAVNNYLAERTATERFVSLWAGIFDLDRHEVVYVDAGHGHWLYKPIGKPVQWTTEGGGIPMGIDEDYPYENAVLPVTSGDRLILYSDGLVEQRSAEGEEFGRERVMGHVADESTPADDLRTILDAFDDFAGSSSLHDDTTIASVQVL